MENTLLTAWLAVIMWVISECIVTSCEWQCHWQWVPLCFTVMFIWRMGVIGWLTFAALAVIFLHFFSNGFIQQGIHDGILYSVCAILSLLTAFECDVVWYFAAAYKCPSFGCLSIRDLINGCSWDDVNGHVLDDTLSEEVAHFTLHHHLRLLFVGQFSQVHWLLSVRSEV